MPRGRLEAFSDGVLAVAITLLVLNLHASADDQGSLAHQLGAEWPSFAAYVLSFFIVGVVWVNHHALFSLAVHVDRALMFWNLTLLLFVTTIPFTASTLASFLRGDTADVRLAVLLYGLSTEGMAVCFTLILRHLLKHGLVERPVTKQEGRRAVLRYGAGAVLYPIVTAIGLLSWQVMLVLYALITVFYIREQTPILADAGDAATDP